MSSVFERIIKSFKDAIQESNNRHTSPYDTQAEVVRVDGDTAWVHIPGGVDETPVQLTTSAKKGDKVQVRISGGRAWLYGNQTNPPTDDTTAISARDQAKAAQKVAEQAQVTADSALKGTKENAAQMAEDVLRINSDIENLQDQIDGNITSWFYPYAPSIGNFPASSWDTTAKKDNHLGDLFYNTITGYAYRFMKDGNTYSWAKITDSDVTEALRIAAEAQDTADSKRRVFFNTPVPPYDRGDLWVQGSNGDILRCNTAKATGGSFAQSDWVLASKYTDDTRANEAYTLASTAKASADGKNTIYRQNTQPTGGTYVAGDVWFDTAHNNKIYRHNGTSWQAVLLGDDALDTFSANHITAGTIDASQVTVSNLDAGNITTGNLDADRMKSKVVSAINATLDKINARNINVDGDLIVGKTYTDDAISDAVNDIEIGGRNLLEKSKNLGSFKAENSTYISTSKTDDYIDVTRKTANGTARYGIYYTNISVSSNTDYTLSFDVSGVTDSLESAIGQITPSGKNAWSGCAGYQTVTNGHYTRTFNTDEATVIKVYLAFKCANGSEWTVRISNIKLEKGNKATDWTPAPEDAISAINAVSSASISETVSVYYRSTTHSAPSISSSTSIGTATNTDNAWEYIMPVPKRDRYFYTCEKYVYGDGSISFSTVRELSSETYASKWVHASNSTYIDGGRLYANSVTATQIKTDTITVGSLSDGSDYSTTDQMNNAIGSAVDDVENDLSEESKKRESSTNILLDTDVPSLTAVNANYGRYFSDAGNSSYITCSIVPISDPPEPSIKYAYRAVGNGTNTVNAGRGLSFNNATNTTEIPFKVGTEYTVSFWGRCTSGSAKTHVDYRYTGTSNRNALDTITDLTSSWKLYTGVIKLDSIPTDYNRVWFYIRFDAGVTGTAELCGFKIVAGNHVSYITEINQNGIWVTPRNKRPTNTSTGAGATGAKINANGMDVYKDGEKKASYGATQYIYGGNGTYPLVNVNGTDVKIMKSEKIHADITSSGLELYRTLYGDESVKVATIGAGFEFTTLRGWQSLGDKHMHLEAVSSGGDATIDGYTDDYNILRMSIDDDNCHLQLGAEGGATDRGYFKGRFNPATPSTSTSNGYYLGDSNNKWRAVYASNGTIQTSDKKYKDVIGNIDFAKNLIMGLEPVEYQWKESNHKRTHMGLIAQDSAEVAKSLGKDLSFYEAQYIDDSDYHGEETDDTNLMWSMKYDELIAPLIKVVQEQQSEIDELRQRIEALEGRV